MKRVVEVLQENGPMMSGDISKILIKDYYMTDVAARKAISRAKSPVLKLDKINFEKNQKFLYLKNQFASKTYFDRLIDSLRNHSKIYYQAINAIKYNGGYITSEILPCYMAAPIKNLKGHTRSDVIIDGLIQTKLIYRENDYFFSVDSKETEEGFKRSKATEIAKETVINDLCNNLERLNVIAYNMSSVFTKESEFYKFQWGFTAPSYLNTLIKINKGNVVPCFLVGDIILSKNLGMSDIDFFIDKVDIIKNASNSARFIPVIIAYGYTKEVHKILKSKGVVVATVTELFGSQYAIMLKQLVSTIKNVSKTFEEEPNKLMEYIEKIAHFDGKFGNAVGALFEATVGLYFHHVGTRTLEVNKIIRYEENVREIDVYIEQGNSITVIECKGIKGQLSDETIEEWLTRKVPINFKYIKKNNPNSTINFEIWSTGGFDEEAIRRIIKSQGLTKKYSINYLDGSGIREKATKENFKLLKNCIDIITK